MKAEYLPINPMAECHCYRGAVGRHEPQCAYSAEGRERRRIRPPILVAFLDACDTLRDVITDMTRECEVCQEPLTNIGLDADGELRGDCPTDGRTVAWQSGLVRLAYEMLEIAGPNGRRA